MDGFLEILLKVGNDPKSWVVVALLGLWAGASLYRLVKCPIANARIKLSPESAHATLNRRIRHPLSYLVIMLLGMAVAVAGLIGLSKQDDGSTLPFFMLAVGLFVILTLPVRMRIKDAELRVIAAQTEESRAVLAQTLRHEHRALLHYEFGILLLLALVLVMF
ncbi:MAG TPA: hypothetical protein VFR34_08800 [Paracoccaceae bacterium]|nr:hypothetical protein [Paracoccaceae bacterium]